MGKVFLVVLLSFFSLPTLFIVVFILWRIEKNKNNIKLTTINNTQDMTEIEYSADNEDYDQIIKNYKENSALKGNKDPELLNSIAALYILSGKDYDNAMKYYKEAIALPDNGSFSLFTSTIGVGEVYNYQKDYDNSIKYYKKAMTLTDDDNPDILASIGLAYYSNQDYDNAMKCYKKASVLVDDDNSDILASIGLAYYGNKDYNNAIKYCEKSILLNLNAEPDVYICLGKSFFNIGVKKWPWLKTSIQAAIGSGKITQDKIDSMYDSSVKDFKAATRYFEKALQNKIDVKKQEWLEGIIGTTKLNIDMAKMRLGGTGDKMENILILW